MNNEKVFYVYRWNEVVFFKCVWIDGLVIKRVFWFFIELEVIFFGLWVL